MNKNKAAPAKQARQTQSKLAKEEENIPLQDLSETSQVQGLTDTADEVETTVTSFMALPEARTQTERLNYRELEALDKTVNLSII